MASDSSATSAFGSATEASTRGKAARGVDSSAGSVDGGAPRKPVVDEGGRTDDGVLASAAAPVGSTGDATSVSTESQRTGWLLDVAVLGGGTLDAAAQATGVGSVTVRGAWKRWGLLLDAGLESTRTASRDVVIATADSQWLSVSFSVGFEPISRLTLDVALGLRGWRTAAWAAGVTTRDDKVALSWGGLVSAGLGWRLTGPVFLHARAFGSLRSTIVRFNVEPLGTVLELNPLNFGLLAGVQWRFE